MLFEEDWEEKEKTKEGEKEKVQEEEEGCKMREQEGMAINVAILIIFSANQSIKTHSAQSITKSII